LAEKPENDLPLTEAAFFILLSVAHKPLHGYAIIKRAGALSAGRIRLSTGTLYGSLKRFLDSGWIERVDEVDTAGATPPVHPRKAYRLTRRGLRILDAETGRLKGLVAAADKAMAVAGKGRSAWSEA
jgi:DNA-binding PadR family transcriptional regulator